MTTQLSILDLLDGKQLAATGLEMAVDHAEGVAPGWKERAWKVFLEWLSAQKYRSTFKIEQFRIWCELNDKIEKPPSKRAYGFLPIKAAKEQLIAKAGYSQVTNPKAHSANCSLWMVIG